MVRWLRWHCPPDTWFEPWRSEAEHATSRSQRLPTIPNSHVDGEETFIVSFKLPKPGTEPWTLAWMAAVLTTTPEPPPRPPYIGARFPVSAVWKKQKKFLPHPRVKVSIVGSLRDREVACSASDRQGSNFESCVWRTVSSQSSHHPQEVLLAQFSLYVHKGGLKPDSFHFMRRPMGPVFSPDGLTIKQPAKQNMP